jgi:hypothetical protein
MSEINFNWVDRDMTYSPEQGELDPENIREIVENDLKRRQRYVQADNETYIS